MSVTGSKTSILPPVGVKFGGVASRSDVGDQLCKAAAAGNKRLLKKMIVERGVCMIILRRMTVLEGEERHKEGEERHKEGEERHKAGEERHKAGEERHKAGEERHGKG